MGRPLLLIWTLFIVAWGGVVLYALFGRPDWLLTVSQWIGYPVSFLSPAAIVLIVAAPVAVGILLWLLARLLSPRR